MYFPTYGTYIGTDKGPYLDRLVFFLYFLFFALI